MSLEAAIPGHTPQDWARAFLTAIGAPVTVDNIDGMVRWMRAESGGYNPSLPGGKFNPLNVTEPGFGSTSAGGSQGNIRDYPTFEQGVAASAHLFTHNGNAERIITALRSNAGVQALENAVNAFYSSWGGGINFGGIAEAGPGGAGTQIPPGDFRWSDVFGSGGTGGNANPDDECLIRLPGASLGPLDVGGNCLVDRSQGRALLGAAALTAGVALMLVGLVLAGVSTRPGQVILSAATKGAA